MADQWEYLTLDMWERKPHKVNGQELQDWKRLDLSAYLNQLGADGWEMSGALTSNNYDFGILFFKRRKQ
jgi:hypothetical protein